MSLTEVKKNHYNRIDSYELFVPLVQCRVFFSWFYYNKSDNNNVFEIPLGTSYVGVTTTHYSLKESGKQMRRQNAYKENRNKQTNCMRLSSKNGLGNISDDTGIELTINQCFGFRDSVFSVTSKYFNRYKTIISIHGRK